MSPVDLKGGSTPPRHRYAQNPSQTQAFAYSDGYTRWQHTGLFPCTMAHPRNIQNERRSNKMHRKPRLYDEDDALAEHAALRIPGSRRGQTSITHLMSFALPPRPANIHSHRNHSLRQSSAGGMGSGYHAVDKSRYIHANYRFIVDPRGDYSPQMGNSDAHVEWERILQVLASLTDDTSCPICLNTPVAPRMAKCGHIFCLSCILRYMHAVEDTTSTPGGKRRWKPCPICFDSIFLQELKPVRWMQGEVLEVPMEGININLRLMTRRSDSTLSLPRSLVDADSLTRNMPWHFQNGVLEYAHFMKGTESYILDQYERELKALEMQESEDEVLFGEDTQWYQKAIAVVRGMKEGAVGIGAQGVQESNSQVHETTSSGDRTTTYLYFYQGPLHSYLSPLDIRILKATFGDFVSFPSTMLPIVEHISTGHVVDDVMRKRTKYLAHLPLGREISFLECDWTGVIPESILSKFKEDVEKRRKRNHEKAVREEKARVRAELNEDKKLYGNRRLSYSLSSAHLDYLSEEKTGSLPSSTADLWSTSSPPASVASTSRQHTSTNTLSSSTSPDSRRTVWGTPLVLSQSDEHPVVESTQLPEYSDGWLDGWEGDTSEDYITRHMDVTAVRDRPDGEVDMPLDLPTTKKKKKKKITLMSTNGRRAAL